MGHVLMMRKGSIHAFMSLPDGYTKQGYIQSSGTQYINTEFNPNQNTRVIIDFEPLVSTTWKGVFGSRLAAGDNEFAVDFESATSLRSMYGTGYKNLSTTMLSRFLVDKNKETCTVNGSIISNDPQTFQVDYPIWLFSKNTGNTAWGLLSMKLYSCKIYDNGILVRNFVPCTNPSGKYGLYDLVGRKFYEDAASGSFTGGS